VPAPGSPAKPPWPTRAPIADLEIRYSLPRFSHVPPERRNVTAKRDRIAWVQPVKVCASELLTERGYSSFRRL
jgi:hypothetical protein